MKPPCQSRGQSGFSGLSNPSSDHRCQKSNAMVWVRNSIDRFVLAKLDQEKLSPSPEADRVTLIRRLSFDLTGLPPTPKKSRDLLETRIRAAYENLVDPFARFASLRRALGRDCGSILFTSAKRTDTTKTSCVPTPGLTATT
jgi:hypothetical protein